MTGQKFKVTHEAALLQYLFEILPGQSRTGVKNLLSKGQVLVNGEGRTAFDHPLKTGDVITILPKGISIARSVREDARETVTKAGVKILFEDENYIVADKPSGMLTVATGKESGVLLSACGVVQVAGTDFAVSGKTVSWTGKGLAEVDLVAGDTFVIQYQKKT